MGVLNKTQTCAHSHNPYQFLESNPAHLPVPVGFVQFPKKEMENENCF